MGSPRRDTSGKETVHTFGDADDGRDYTSLSTWETARGDCVGNSTCYVLECYRDQTSYAQTVSVSGGTVSSTYFRVIRAASGARHAGVPGTGIKLTSNYTGPIVSDEDYFSVEDIEVLNTGYNGSGTVYGINLNNGVGQTVINCIAKATNAGTGVACGVNLSHYTAGDGGYAYNCCVYECTSGSGTGIGFQVDSRGGGSGCYNCQAIGCTTYGFRDTNGTTTLFKGCGAYGNGTDISGGDVTANNVSGGSPTFNDAGNDDYRITAADDDWREADTNTGNWHATCGYDTDVADTTRPQGTNWDVGFFEVVAAGGETREFSPLPAGVSATSTSIAVVIRPVEPAIAGASATGAAIAAILRELAESVAASSATAEIVVTVTGLIELSASMTGASATSAVYELILREILLSLTGVSTVSEISLDVTGAAVQDQEGFRFRNDDGTEVTATWRAVQDTDISLQSGINFRLRFIINTTGDAAASQYQVEYKKSTDADWLKVV